MIVTTAPALRCVVLCTGGGPAGSAEGLCDAEPDPEGRGLLRRGAWRLDQGLRGAARLVLRARHGPREAHPPARRLLPLAQTAAEERRHHVRPAAVRHALRPSPAQHRRPPAGELAPRQVPAAAQALPGVAGVLRARRPVPGALEGEAGGAEQPWSGDDRHVQGMDGSYPAPYVRSSKFSLTHSAGTPIRPPPPTHTHTLPPPPPPKHMVPCREFGSADLGKARSLNWANVCSPNILRTLRRTMIRFFQLLVRRIWFGQSKLYFILNWLVMRCKLRPELAAWSKM